VRSPRQIQAKLRGALYYPWFLTCNPDRLPRWHGKPDLRLHSPRP
jgi:hypothetical protein